MFRPGETVLVEYVNSMGMLEKFRAEFLKYEMNPMHPASSMAIVKALEGELMPYEIKVYPGNIAAIPAPEHSVNVASAYHKALKGSYITGHDFGLRGDTMKAIKKRNPCECGAHAIKDARHSHWCPLHG